MRRQTLSSMSPAQANSRASLGPARVQHSVTSAKKRQSGRPSIGNSSHRGSSTRRSSMYGSSTMIVKDPRPLSDKAFKEQSIRSIITYLSSHGYEHPVSPKTLLSPTSKDFMNMVQFLFKCIDPKMRFDNVKMEDEVPLVFRRLRYPFQISKSALYAVGSPHTWPSLLGALTWIVELLDYEECANEIRQSGEDNPSSTFDNEIRNRQVFNYVVKCYEAFLSGQDDVVEELDQELVNSFAEADQQVEAECEKLDGEIAELEESITALREGESPLEEQQRIKKDLEEDLGKLENLLENFKSHRLALQRKLADLQIDQESKESELESIETENEALRNRISSQDINKEDMDRMYMEKTKLEGQLNSLASHRAKIDEKLWEHQKAVSTKQSEVEKVVSEYTAMADRLKVIPASMKRANGVDFQIRLDFEAKIPEEILGMDIKVAIKPALIELQQSYSEKARNLQTELLELQEQCDMWEEKLQNKRQESEQVTHDLNRYEVNYRTLKEKVDEDIKIQGSEAEKIEANIALLRSRVNDELAEKERKFKETQDQLQLLTNQIQGQRATLTQELIAALDIFMEHKKVMQETIEDIYKNISDVSGKLHRNAGNGEIFA